MPMLEQLKSEGPGHKGPQTKTEQQKTRLLNGFLGKMVEVRGIEPRSEKEATIGSPHASPSTESYLWRLKGSPTSQTSPIIRFKRPRTEINLLPHVK